MTYDPFKDSGMAERKQYIHVPSGDFVDIIQGSNSEPSEQRNYAQLVYQVNSTELSGSVSNTENVTDTYSRFVDPSDDPNLYIAHAPEGSELSAAVWRIQKIDENGSRQWADGNTNFDNVATPPLSGLTYSY